MLILLYAVCGLFLGFIVGYWYGYDTHSYQMHSRKIDPWSWFKRRIIDGEL